VSEERSSSVSRKENPMRKLILCLMAVLVALPAAASAQQSYLELLRSDIRAEKVALITEVMAFTDEQAEVFWPVYREMESELNKLTDQRITLIKDYAEAYDSMTDKKAKEIVNRAMTLREKHLAIEKKYFRKFSNALDPVTAAKFYQVNREMDLMIDLQVNAGLPFFE
jgi:hypothetical protein